MEIKVMKVQNVVRIMDSTARNIFRKGNDGTTTNDPEFLIAIKSQTSSFHPFTSP
jgi:hypothetical protein